MKLETAPSKVGHHCSAFGAAAAAVFIRCVFTLSPFPSLPPSFVVYDDHEDEEPAMIQSPAMVPM